MKIVDPGIAAHPDHAIVWREEGLFLLDQRVLPGEERFVLCQSAPDVAEAIQTMVVRGAPAIGIAAAYGVVLAAKQALGATSGRWSETVLAHIDGLARARPTAVNLGWALQRMTETLTRLGDDEPLGSLTAAAVAIHEQDLAANRRMGELGAALIEGPATVLTHCNAGGLATGGYGTALGVIRKAFEQGKLRLVFADETRPWLQGARLTAWELQRDGIPVSLIADGAAAARMQLGGVDWVIVGSDRIAANGDVANKIGTYGLAVAARHHGVRFMVVAPTSTIDLSVGSGAQIPIEERPVDELLFCAGRRVAALGAAAWNPVFDVTPAALIDVIVTERGVIEAPNVAKVAHLMLGSSEPGR